MKVQLFEGLYLSCSTLVTCLQQGRGLLPTSSWVCLQLPAAALHTALLLTCLISLLHKLAWRLLIASRASSQQPACCCAGLIRAAAVVAADAPLHMHKAGSMPAVGVRY